MSRLPRLAPLVLTSLALALAAVAPAAASAASATVHLRGTAYEFNNTKVKLAGAQVRVAENPALGATVAADGTYDLAVPDRARITPYINAAGHHTIHLQTFRTDGQDLERVNFQVPSDAIYGALATLLKVPLAPDGNPAQCAIVSTFSTRNVRDVPFDAFTAYGAHGVAGATATAIPSLGRPVYFNESVIPDPTRARSSADGGVIWPVARTGTFTIRATRAGTRFAPFTATCAPGRIVNANPPWGLHELGKPNHARVTARWQRGRLTRLRVTNTPRGATTTVTCTGKGCPFATKVAAELTRATLRRLRRTTQTITVLVTAHAHDGRLVRIAPSRQTSCVPLGETKPRRSCAGLTQ